MKDYIFCANDPIGELERVYTTVEDAINEKEDDFDAGDYNPGDDHRNDKEIKE